MIQELLGGNNVTIISSPSPSLSPSSSATTTAAAAAAPENLRCPRCDSSNTKFCYYNNYNLTQPRHFCKTCRRYWTKGGALRNVPIGGGCRKNKPTTITSAGKLKSVSSEIVKTASSLSGNPILWAPSQNSHFLSLLRANNQNPNFSNQFIKDENLLFGPSQSISMDHPGPAHLPSTGLSNSLFRNQTPSSQGNNSIVHGDQFQNNGLQDLYQRLKSSSTNYYPEHGPVILGNFASANNSSAILESAPVELGFWNPNLSWSNDLPTTNGAYP
ncbi:hypothetical protein DH2020_037360 [Rehmannia glutinosa]|uniref:Dof zinc finger protein n=1 Tax=Rehmannia glutinosa TaxID=99300 RepID=A0ABR0V1N5_REHGL